jgi:ABC-type uncharacterized transport system fused permease/ATPase subunit
MNPDQLGFTLVLVAVLLGLAVYFGRQQLRTLRGLKSPDSLPAEDRRYLRSQAYRRLFCSALMVAIAGLLIGWLFLEAEHRELQKALRAAQEVDPGAVPTQEQRDFAHLFWLYLSAALLVLLILLVLATMDFWATARYGLSQRRKLQADHRAILEEQLARRRQERNGQQRNPKS